MQFGGGHATWPLHAMAGLGIVMMLIFGHIRFAVFPRIRRAVQAQKWPDGAQAVGTIRRLVLVNIVLGVVTIGVAVFSPGVWSRPPPAPGPRQATTPTPPPPAPT